MNQLLEIRLNTMDARIDRIDAKINFLYVFIAGSQALLGAWLKYGGGV